MDPLSLSASVAGFIGLTIQISQILKAYIGGVQSAPEEARNLLTQVDALNHVLQHLIDFLRTEDMKGRGFSKTSVLCVAIAASQKRLEQLYLTLGKLQSRESSTKFGKLRGRIEWPLKKEEYHQTLTELQKFAQTFQFSLVVSNCELLSETSSSVLLKLEKNQEDTEKIISSLNDMSIAPPLKLIQQRDQISEIKSIVAELADSTAMQLQNISLGVGVIQERQKANETGRLISSLSPLEPQNRHQEIRAKRLQGTGDWFLNNSDYKSWRDDRDDSVHSVFICSGIQGAGKSVICSLVIDDLYSRMVSENSFCVAYLYCDYTAAESQTPANMLASLLKQALSTLNQSHSLPTELAHSLEKRLTSEPDKRLDLNEICEFLVQAVVQFTVFHICIDALDEYKEKDLGILLEWLENTSKDCIGKISVRIFVTGRSHLHWEQQIRRHAGLGNRVNMSLEANPEDIKKYVLHEIQSDQYPRCMNDSLRTDILVKIAESSDGMFLLPALQIQSVLDHTTISKRRKALDTMPSKLESAFQITIDRIREQNSQRFAQAIDVLKWVFLAKEQLTVTQLCHALAVTIESDSSDDSSSGKKLDWENFPDEQSLIDWCLGLVIIDEETSSIRLVHKSLHEYLAKEYESGKIFHNGDGEIAQICLQYMLFMDSESVEVPQLDCLNNDINHILESRVQRFSLLWYAIYNWGHHARKQTTDEVEILAMDILVKPPRSDYISFLLYAAPCQMEYQQLSYAFSVRYKYQPRFNSSHLLDFSGLHLAAHFGVERIFRILVETLDPGIDQKDGQGRTPLSYASESGSGEIVRLILAREGVDINSRDKYDRTALSWASKRGHEEVVGLLLARSEIDINPRDKYDQTALSWASRYGHHQVVCLLLARSDIDINLRDIYDRTALSWASENGYGEVVRLLLTREDVDINLRDNGGRTALSRASRYGYRQVVCLLLARSDIDINSRDSNDRTALSLASERGHEEVVGLLLARSDIDINSRDEYGRTALSWASKRGHEEVVGLLLARSDIDINSRDSDDRTALSLASEDGNEEVVGLLLARSDIDINSRDSDGRTALSLASENGHEEVVGLLLARSDIDINSRDNGGWTALSWASLYDHHQVVCLLLARSDIDINSKNNSGYTALSWASTYGHHQVVGLLLARSDIDINLRNNRGRTALSLASEGVNEEVVRILLARDDIDIDIQDYMGRTALSWATIRRHKSIIGLLEEKKQGITIGLENDDDASLI